MLHLGNVLQFIIHSLNDRPLPEQQFVGNGHQSSLHVAPEFRDKLNAIHEKSFKQMLSNISFVTNELSIYEFDKSLIFKRFPVVNITRRYHKVEQFTFLVAYQVKFEPKEPTHEAFASLCDTLESLVNTDSLILAYSQRSAVDKTDTCTLAKQDFLDELYQWDGNLPFQFNETIV